MSNAFVHRDDVQAAVISISDLKLIVVLLFALMNLAVSENYLTALHFTSALSCFLCLPAL